MGLRSKGATREEYNEYFREYRKKNLAKLRKRNRERMRRVRAEARAKKHD